MRRSSLWLHSWRPTCSEVENIIVARSAYFTKRGGKRCDYNTTLIRSSLVMSPVLYCIQYRWRHDINNRKWCHTPSALFSCSFFTSRVGCVFMFVNVSSLPSKLCRPSRMFREPVYFGLHVVQKYNIWRWNSVAYSPLNLFLKHVTIIYHSSVLRCRFLTGESYKEIEVLLFLFWI